MAPLIGNKTIYINFDLCYKYVVNNGQVERTHDMHLSCPAHEEADTKIVFHVCQIDYEAYVTIRYSDTDVAIIMLANMSALNNANVKVSMEVGVSNNQRFINISKFYETLGSKLSAALPAVHALTGCNCNSAIFKKGKSRPYKLLRNSEVYTDSFMKISNVPDEELQSTFDHIEEYVCRMYVFKKIETVYEARVAIFLKTTIFYETMIYSVYRYQHLLRTTYIANIWAYTHPKLPTTLHSTDFGWEEKENKFLFKWFEGEQLPANPGDITIEDEQKSAAG
nr:unnamed protein product [Callosobruchus chinensis]